LNAGVRSVVKLILILLDETKKYITNIASIIYDLNKKDPADEKLLEKSFPKEIYSEISGKKLLKKSPEENIRDRDNEKKEKLIKEFFLSESEKLIK
jgi:hypothetical protein